MEEILSIVVFGLGATLGIKAVETVRGGLRPVVKEAMKGGMAAGDMARTVASKAKTDGRERATETRAPATAVRRARRPTKIEVVREEEEH